MGNSIQDAELLATIFSQCEQENNCLVWTKTRRKNYGSTKIDGKDWATHRLVATLVHGEQPDNKPFVLHSCDNPPCCNPNHLRWGDQFENMRDAKIRNRKAITRGERNGRSKLNTEKVALIRGLSKNGFTTLEIANLFQVSNQLISRIVRNEAWIDSENW